MPSTRKRCVSSVLPAPHWLSHQPLPSAEQVRRCAEMPPRATINGASAGPAHCHARCAFPRTWPDSRRNGCGRSSTPCCHTLAAASAIVSLSRVGLRWGSALMGVSPFIVDSNETSAPARSPHLRGFAVIRADRGPRRSWHLPHLRWLPRRLRAFLSAGLDEYGENTTGIRFWVSRRLDGCMRS